MSNSKLKGIFIVKELVKAGFEAYFAGGWVRDYILHHPSDDVDIATNATPEQVQVIFEKTIPVGIQFGVVIVVLDDEPFEVSTFRCDGPYIDGRKPESVIYCSSKEDALRRDFTINGMFYDPIKDDIIDYVGGREDLKKKVIRTIGSAEERFKEDRLRMIRAIRFSGRLGFSIDSETRQAIIKNAHTLFPSVSMERVWQEFKKMQKHHFVMALQQLHTYGLLQIIFPKLKKYSSERFYKLSSPMELFPVECPTILYLIDLFPYEKLSDLLEIGNYLKVSKKDLTLIKEYYHSKKLLLKGKQEKRSIELCEWAYFYAYEYSSIFLDMVAARMGRGIIKEHKEREFRLKVYISRIKNKTPVISGSDLRHYGVPEGKRLGMLLKEAERISINQGIENSIEIMEKLQRSAIWVGDEFRF